MRLPSRARRCALPAVLAATLVAATVTVAGAPAGASAPQLQAVAQYLTGSAGATNLGALSGAATAIGGVSNGNVLAPLSSNALNGLATTLPGNIPLFGNSGVLALGSVTQVAHALADGSAFAASGNVSTLGAILGGNAQGGATIDASALLSSVPVVGNALQSLAVQLTGIAATATQAPFGGLQTGAYSIVGGVLTAHSSTISGIPSSILSALGPVQSALNGLGGSSGGLASAFNAIPVVGSVLAALTGPQTTAASVTSNLSSVVTPLLGQLTSPDGFVGLDLGTGAITADLAGLTGGLSSMTPGSQLLSNGLLSTISGDVTGLISTLVTTVQSAVTSAINAAPVSFSSVGGNGITGLSATVTGTLSQIVNGTANGSSALTLLGLPLSLPLASLLSALTGPINTSVLNSVLPTFGGALPGLSSTPVGNTVAPALSALSQVLSMTMNSQSIVNQVFTETAVILQLLPGNPLSTIGLGSASVGPNLGAVSPTAAALFPTSGPASGGHTVSMTGTGFLQGLTSVSIGGTPVTTTVATPTRLSFVAPAHAAGSASVVISNGVGLNSGGLTFTYRSAPSISRASGFGSAAGGQTVTVLGSGFVPGGTAAVLGGTTVPPSEVRVVSSTQLTFPAPTHVPGRVALAVRTVGGTSNAKPYLYNRGVRVRPLIKAFGPGSGRSAGGVTVGVTGSGFVPGLTVVRFGTSTVGATVTSSSRLSFITPAHAAGVVALALVTSGRVSNVAHFRVTTTVPTASAKPVFTAPANGSTSSTQAPWLSGTGVTGATVVVLVDGTAYCRATVASGSWSCASATALLPGTHVFVASQGQSGHSASVLVRGPVLRIS